MELDYQGKKPLQTILELAQKEERFIGFNPLSSYIIKGDNFRIMSALLNSGWKGKIDLIYIDPPFSTNSDFIVSETRKSTVSMPKNGQIAYSDKLKTEEYLEYIRERVILIYNLLSEKGSFYFHIDSKIGHYVKIVLDEIFGIDNFLNDITRKKSNPKNFFRKAYGNEKDVILFYAKIKGNQIWNDIKKPVDEDIKKNFTKTDANGRTYTTVPLHAPGESNGVTGSKWKNMNPPEGRHWRRSPEELDKLNEQGLIEWSSTGNPRLIKYLDNHAGSKVQDIWLDFKDYTYPEYPTQKNLDMLDLIVKQSSEVNSFVLDAFAGSGTTLLAAKNNNRKFVAIDKEELAIEIINKKLNSDFFSQEVVRIDF